jgi:hypothetical protein
MQGARWPLPLATSIHVCVARKIWKMTQIYHMFYAISINFLSDVEIVANQKFGPAHTLKMTLFIPLNKILLRI